MNAAGRSIVVVFNKSVVPLVPQRETVDQCWSCLSSHHYGSQPQRSASCDTCETARWASAAGQWQCCLARTHAGEAPVACTVGPEKRQSSIVALSFYYVKAFFYYASEGTKAKDTSRGGHMGSCWGAVHGHFHVRSCDFFCMALPSMTPVAGLP